LYLTGKKIANCRRFTAIWYVNQFGTGHGIEELGGNVCQASAASRREIDLARIGFCIIDELGEGFRRK
jgi:hypothetical protein